MWAIIDTEMSSCLNIGTGVLLLHRARVMPLVCRDCPHLEAILMHVVCHIHPMLLVTVTRHHVPFIAARFTSQILQRHGTQSFKCMYNEIN